MTLKPPFTLGLCTLGKKEYNLSAQSISCHVRHSWAKKIFVQITETKITALLNRSRDFCLDTPHKRHQVIILSRMMGFLYLSRSAFFPFQNIYMRTLSPQKVISSRDSWDRASLQWWCFLQWLWTLKMLVLLAMLIQDRTQTNTIFTFAGKETKEVNNTVTSKRKM